MEDCSLLRSPRGFQTGSTRRSPPTVCRRATRLSCGSPPLPARRPRVRLRLLEPAAGAADAGCKGRGEDAVAPLIEVRNLKKTYWLGEVAVNALVDVTITIEKGS